MWWCWWGRTAPARPIASRRSRFCRRDAACAARRSMMSPTTRATAPGRSPPRSKARSGLPRSAPASIRPAAEAATDQPALPHRPRAGQFGDRLRRSSAHGVADARDGRAVPRRRLRTAAVLRPAGAGDRQRAFQPRVGAGPFAALAQPPAGSAQLRRPLVRRDRARNRRARGRGRRDARPDRDAAAAMLRERGDGFGLSVGADHARRLDGKRAGQRARHRGGGSLPRDPARQPRRATPRPAARSTGRISPICR